jgi:hypothetical protein
MAKRNVKKAAVVADLSQERAKRGEVMVAKPISSLGISEEAIESHMTVEERNLAIVKDTCATVVRLSEKPEALASFMAKLGFWIDTIVEQIQSLSDAIRQKITVRTFLVLAEELPAIKSSLDLLVDFGTKALWISDRGQERPLLEDGTSVPKDLRVQVGGEVYTSYHATSRVAIINSLRQFVQGVGRRENEERLTERSERLAEMQQGIKANIVKLVEGRSDHFSFDYAAPHNNRGRDFPGVFLRFERLAGDRIRLVDYFVDAPYDNTRIRELVEQGDWIPVAVVGQTHIPKFDSCGDVDKRRRLVLLTILTKYAWMFVHNHGNLKDAITGKRGK